jgi:hypothetical protein
MNDENEWDGKVEADVVHGPMERVMMEVCWIINGTSLTSA